MIGRQLRPMRPASWWSSFPITRLSIAGSLAEVGERGRSRPVTPCLPPTAMCSASSDYRNASRGAWSACYGSETKMVIRTESAGSRASLARIDPIPRPRQETPQLIGVVIRKELHHGAGRIGRNCRPSNQVAPSLQVLVLVLARDFKSSQKNLYIPIQWQVDER